MNKLLFKELHYDLIKYLAEKNSFKQIAEALGCSQTIVVCFARKHGIETHFKKRKENLENGKEYVALKLSSGTSVSDIAKQFNVSPDAVRALIKKYGIKTKDQVAKEELEDRKKELESSVLNYCDKMTIYSFSKKFGMSAHLVKQIADKLGVKFKKLAYLDDMHEEIVATLKDKTVSQASKILDIDSEILRTYAKKNNVQYLKHKGKDKLPGHVVYAYYDKDGVVRYYGEGSSETRALQFKSHADSKGYHKYFSDDDLPVVKFLHWGLTKEEAKRIEHDLVQENLSTVATIYNHHHTDRSKKSLAFETAEEFVYYDESSPTCLRWKEGKEYNGFRKQHSVAGTIPKNGSYMSVRFKNETYRVHTVVWLLHNKSFSKDMVIDHIDGDPQNNKISNLREVDASFNCKNRLGNSNTGYKNLYWSEKYRGYLLKYNIDKSRKTIFFSVAKYDSKENALEAALEKRKELIDQQLIVIREGDK